MSRHPTLRMLGHVFAISASLAHLDQFHLIHIRAKLLRLLRAHRRSRRASGAIGTALERAERRCALSHRSHTNLNGPKNVQKQPQETTTEASKEASWKVGTTTASSGRCGKF